MHMPHRFCHQVAGLAAVVLLSAGCGPATPATTPASTAVSAPVPTTAPVPATQAQPTGAKTPLTVIIGLPLGSAANAYYWIGKYLGYFDQEGIDVDVESTGGNAQQAVAMVVSGQGDVATFSLDSILGPAAQGQDVPMISVYTVYPTAIFVGAVLPDSPIKSIADLKGKTVGVPQTGPTYESYLAAAAQEAGMAPSDLHLQATGIGVPMAEALKQGQVAAIFGTIGQFTPLETQGYAIRYLPRPKIAEELIGSSILMKNDLPPAKQQAVRGYLRALAKSIVFAKANPEATVRVDWAMYPQAKPKDVPEDKALKDAAYQLKSGLDFAARINGQWGYTPPEKVQNYVEFLGYKGKFPDLTKFYTNSMIDFVNQFDEQQIQAEAQQYKLPGS